MSSRLVNTKDAAWKTAAESTKCAKSMQAADLLAADIDGNCVVDAEDRTAYDNARMLVVEGKAESCPDEGSECDSMLKQAMSFYATDPKACLAKLGKEGKLTMEDAEKCFAAEFCAEGESDAVQIGLNSDICQPCLHDCDSRERLEAMSSAMCCPRLCKRLQKAEKPCTDINLDINKDCKVDEKDATMMSDLAPEESYSRMCDEPVAAPKVAAVSKDASKPTIKDMEGAFHLQQLAKGFADWAPGTDEKLHLWGVPHKTCSALDREQDADRFLEPGCCPSKEVLAADGAATCQEWQQMKGSKAAMCLTPAGDDWCYSESCCHIEFGESCRTMLLELKGNGKADVETTCAAHGFGHGDDAGSMLKDAADFGASLLKSSLLPKLQLTAPSRPMTCAKFVHFARTAATGDEPCCAELNGKTIFEACPASCPDYDANRCATASAPKAVAKPTAADDAATQVMPTQTLRDFASAVGEAVCPQHVHQGTMALGDWEQCKLTEETKSSCPEVAPLVLAYYACLKSGNPCACHGFDEAKLADQAGFQSHPFKTETCKMTEADRSWLAGFATLAPAKVEGDYYSCMEKLGQAMYCLLEEHRTIFWLDGASPNLKARTEAFTEEVTELAASCGAEAPTVAASRRKLWEGSSPWCHPGSWRWTTTNDATGCRRRATDTLEAPPSIPPPSPPPPPPVSMVTMWMVLIAEFIMDPKTYWKIMWEYIKDIEMYLMAGGDAWKSPNPPPPAPPPPALKRRLDRIDGVAEHRELFSASASSCSWVKRENATFDGVLQRAVAEMRDDVLAWRDGSNVYKASSLAAAQQMCSTLPGCFGFSGSVETFFLPAVDTHYLAERGSSAYRKVSKTSQWSGAMNNFWLSWPRSKQQERTMAEFWALVEDINIQPCTSTSTEVCGLAHAKSMCEHDDECGGLTKRVGGAYRGVKYAWEKPQVGYTSWVKIPTCGEESAELPWWHPSRHTAPQ